MKKILIILSCVNWLNCQAQTEKFTLQQAIDVALKNNEGLQAASYDVEAATHLKKTSFDLPKTSVLLTRGQYNSYSKKDNNLTITQTIPFAVLGSLGQLNRSLLASSELNRAKTENELILQVKLVYYEILYVKDRQRLLMHEDSILFGFLKSASARLQTGDASLLEKTTAETQHNEIKNRLLENEVNLNILRTQLGALLNHSTIPDIQDDSLPVLQIERIPDSVAILTNPALSHSRQQVEVARSQKKVEATKMVPDLVVGYFNQTLVGVVDLEQGKIANQNDRFTGVQVGLSIPLWFVPQQGRVKAAEINRQAASSRYKYDEIRFESELKQTADLHAKYSRSLEYYRTSALPNANLILHQFYVAYHNGEIGFAEYLLGVRSALGIKERYLQTLNDYNQNVIYIQYLAGNK